MSLFGKVKSLNLLNRRSDQEDMETHSTTFVKSLSQQLSSLTHPKLLKN
jgi:hypothetical protein